MSDIPTQHEIEQTRKMAEEGDAYSQCKLAYWYLYGQGLSKDLKQSVYWYHKAADQGYSHGQFMLAYHYKQGNGVERNIGGSHCLFRTHTI